MPVLGTNNTQAMREVFSYSLRGAKCSTGYQAEKPMATMPKIIEEYADNGQRMYRGADGRVFFADLFDRFFKPEMRLRVISQKEEVAKRRATRGNGRQRA